MTPEEAIEEILHSERRRYEAADLYPLARALKIAMDELKRAIDPTNCYDDDAEAFAKALLVEIRKEFE